MCNFSPFLIQFAINVPNQTTSTRSFFAALCLCVSATTMTAARQRERHAYAHKAQRRLLCDCLIVSILIIRHHSSFSSVDGDDSKFHHHRLCNQSKLSLKGPHRHEAEVFSLSFCRLGSYVVTGVFK